MILYSQFLLYPNSSSYQDLWMDSSHFDPQNLKYQFSFGSFYIFSHSPNGLSTNALCILFTPECTYKAFASNLNSLLHVSAWVVNSCSPHTQDRFLIPPKPIFAWSFSTRLSPLHSFSYHSRQNYGAIIDPFLPLTLPIQCISKSFWLFVETVSGICSLPSSQLPGFNPPFPLLWITAIVS